MTGAANAPAVRSAAHIRNRSTPGPWATRPRPATLRSVPTDQRLSQTVDQFSGSDHVPRPSDEIDQ
jgi:hypothetical protein